MITEAFPQKRKPVLNFRLKASVSLPQHAISHKIQTLSVSNPSILDTVFAVDGTRIKHGTHICLILNDKKNIVLGHHTMLFAACELTNRVLTSGHRGLGRTSGVLVLRMRFLATPLPPLIKNPHSILGVLVRFANRQCLFRSKEINATRKQTFTK